MKYFGIVALAFVVCVALTSAQSNNNSWGTIGPGDTLLDRQIITKPSKWLRIVTHDCSFPPKGVTPGRLITAIRVTDQYTNGKGAYAILYFGGPGHPSVTIHLKSQRSEGIKSIVEIYGR